MLLAQLTNIKIYKMKKILLLILLGAFFIQCSPKVDKSLSKVKDFRSEAPKAKAAPEVGFGDYDVFSLSNGLKVIVVENHRVPTTSVRLFIDRKPILEGDKAGYIEFAGQLLSRGTKTKTKAEIDDEIDFLGAGFSTFSKGFYVYGLSKHIDDFMSIAADAILNPAFSQEEFDKIKTQKLSELASAKDEANSISGNVSNVLNYGKNHPFGEPITEETVNNITLDDCKSYYENNFGPNIGYLVFVGDINKAEAWNVSNKYFGNWNAKAKIVKSLPSILFPKNTSVSFVPKRGAVQSVVAITYPVDLKPNSPDIIKARVLNTLVGGYFRSRLNQNLREDNAYTYGIRSSLQDNMDLGEFSASASVRNEITDSAIYQILYEFDKIRNEKVPQEELELVKSVMAGNFGRALEDPMTLANFALKTERFNLPKSFYHDYLKNLESVTSEHVYQMAQKYIKPNQANIVVVGDKKEVAEKLKKFGDLKFYDVYGNKVVEQKSTSPALSLEDLYKKNIDALGGQSALDKINNVEFEYVASIQGMEMKLSELKVNGKKSSMSLNMMGQTLQSAVYNGDKGVEIVQGQKKPMGDNELKSAKYDSYIFPVVAMKTEGGMTLTGSEKIDGIEYFIVEKKEKDQTISYYFNAKTFLLDIQEVIVSANGQTQKITYKISDYKKHEGVLMPTKNTMSGAMPVPIEFNLTKSVINGSVDDTKFVVE